MIAFGPVPSRRLGMSLGINHIFKKYCSYACVYCQVGKTFPMTIERKEFYHVSQIVKEVSEHIKTNKIPKKNIDFLTLVTEGEPTLDIRLGELIKELKKIGPKIAVISNSSLITSDRVKEDLNLADWVSLKIDSVNCKIWKKINRPHGKLKLDKILENIIEFKKEYQGFFAVETMFVEGMNTSEEEVDNLSSFISKLSPRTAYLSAPIRPPVESSVQPPPLSFFYKTMDIYKKKDIPGELNCSLEDIHFGYSSGEIEKEIESIVSVHPLREDALKEIIISGSFQWDIVENMCLKGILKKVNYHNQIYYQKG